MNNNIVKGVCVYEFMQKEIIDKKILRKNRINLHFSLYSYM